MSEVKDTGCTGNCGTCGSACDSEKSGPSFFDKMEEVSKVMNDIGEENIIKMLEDAVAEWEADDAAEEAEEAARAQKES